MKIYGNAASGNAYQPETPDLPREFARASHRPWCLDCKRKHEAHELDGDGRCVKCARAAVSRAAAAERRALEEADRKAKEKAAAAANPRPVQGRIADTPSSRPRTRSVSRTVDHSAKIAKLVTQRTALATRLADVDERLAALRAEHGTTVLTTRARTIRNHNGPLPMELPDEEIAAAYLAGATLGDLAAEHGCSSPTIARALDRAGVERRSHLVDYTPALLEDVRRLYIDEQLSQAQVAERLGLTIKVVQTAMQHAQIEAREDAVTRSLAGIGHPIKLQPEDRAQIVARYRAGESAPALAKAFGVSSPSIYQVLRSEGVEERHHTRSVPGHDGSLSLRQRLQQLGVDAKTVKTWAVDHGLIDRVQRGIPSFALVEAYAAAHGEAVSA